MLVMTAKVNKKKVAFIFAAVVLIIAALVMIIRGDGSSAPTVSTGVSDNDGRVSFLESFGWDVTTSPVESGQVKIPKEQSDVFKRYNELQVSQGYDLSKFAGKTVMRYVYQVNNYPGATEPVYASVLIYKDQVIGGDITDTSATGKIQGFRMAAQTP
ncbi:MAG: DUF4830 domain-containing protein [Ruminococcaceae bacterium]|nr:DUF4830 domain-containing protein [Oscillospiraceae bacterium]